MQIALGDKLVEKLSELGAKELEEKMYAMEMEDAAKELARHEHEIAELKARGAALEVSGASREAIHDIEEQIAERTADLAARGKSFEELGEHLLESRKAAHGIIERMQGVAARRIAKLMERESVKMVAEQIARVLPYVDVAMLAIDLGQTVNKLRQMIRDGARFGVIEDSPLPPENGHSGHPGSADGPAASGSASAEVSSPTEKPPRLASGQDRDALAAAQRRLSPSARSILTAVTHHGEGPAVELSARDVDQLGALVPGDLTPDQVGQVVAMLRQGAPNAQTAADAIRAVSSAVTAVRAHRPVTTPGQGTGGPITDPSQVESARAVDDPQAVVESAPPQVIARWFVERDGQLVPSPVYEQWKAAHVPSQIEHGRLVDVIFKVSRSGSSAWDLEVTFHITGANGAPQRTRFHFMVDHGPPSAIGAVVPGAGGLSLEPYINAD